MLFGRVYRVVIFTILVFALSIVTNASSVNLNPLHAGTNLCGYTVQKGDSLFTIARSRGVSVNGIMQANGLKTYIIRPGQVLYIPGKSSEPLWRILKSKGITDPGPGLAIVIDKSEHTLSLFYNWKWLKSYHVDFGEGGLGDKQVSGDRKTPEGTFYITQKLAYRIPDKYLGSRWMRLSYPNIEDAQRGLRDGLIDRATYNSIVAAINAKSTPPQYTALGGGIGIHGGTVPEFGSDWTWGCIGLTNEDVEDFFDYVRIGTPVIITK